MFFFVLTLFILSYSLVQGFGKVAATSSGVNKALQAAILFVFSHLLFCDKSQPAFAMQCMNREKIIGTCGVVAGVLLYAFDKKIMKVLGWTANTSVTTDIAGHVTLLNDSNDV